VFRIESGKYVTTGIGPRRKLDEQRGKQVAKLLFIDIPEVEIEISHRGPPGVTLGFDILNDRGTESMVSVS
jgi:hypothetical protein